MSDKIKLSLIVVASLCIGIAIGYYTTLKKVQREKSIACLNSSLYDLNIEMDLLEHWYAQYKNDSIIEEKIKHLILNKLILLSNSKPKIEKLKGVPVEALYRLINFNEKHNINLENQNDVLRHYLDYLSSVKNEVKQTAEKRKDIKIKALRQLKKE